MDSKLLYSGSEGMKHKVSWNRITSESEWTYIGEGSNINMTMVLNSINCHFSNPLLYVCWTRQNSFEATKEHVEIGIKELLGRQDFFIWDSKFKLVIEFNKIGVMRLGQVNG